MVVWMVLDCRVQAAGQSLRTSLVTLLRSVVTSLRLRPNDLNEVHSALHALDEKVKAAKRVGDGSRGRGGLVGWWVSWRVVDVAAGGFGCGWMGGQLGPWA
jgi:hypothetical protein